MRWEAQVPCSGGSTRGGADTSSNPLQAEDRQEEPAIVLTVRDRDGGVVRRVTGPVSAGTHRITWDLKYPGYAPVTTATHRQQLEIAQRQFDAAAPDLHRLIDTGVPALHARFDAAGIRWTTGRRAPGG